MEKTLWEMTRNNSSSFSAEPQVDYALQLVPERSRVQLPRSYDLQHE